MSEVKNGNTRRSIFDMYSKFRCIIRTQVHILAFGCQLSSERSSIIDVQLGCKGASDILEKDTRAATLKLLWCLFCSVNIFHSWFSCILHIFHMFVLHCYKFRLVTVRPKMGNREEHYGKHRKCAKK